MSERLYSRRLALRAFGMTALGVGATAVRTQRGSAARGWCQADPLFKVGGYLFDVTLSSDAGMLVAASGPVKLTITVPKVVAAEHLISDLGFGHGYEVSVAASKKLRASKTRIDVQVTVRAPAHDSSLPVYVHLTSLSSQVVVSQSTATGSANQAITWSGSIATVSELDSLFEG